jgi:hypothetical protein
MILHYLKVAFRNLWKYKSQTLISIIGLAVGFTCFALATLWIRYETTFDNFHKNADRMYCVQMPLFDPSNPSRATLYPLAGYLRETFPEIANAVPIGVVGYFNVVTINEVNYDVDVLRIDSAFFSFFDVKIIEGSKDFAIFDKIDMMAITPKKDSLKTTGDVFENNKFKKIAITQEKARQLFGNENPIGKIINEEFTICAVVSGLPKHSNYSFDLLYALDDYTRWNTSQHEHTLVELSSNINV